MTKSPTNKLFTHRGRILFFAFGVLICLILGGFLTFSYAYADKATPGTSVAGISLSGKTDDEVRQLIEARVSDLVITFELDGVETEATLDDLGISISLDDTLEEVFSTSGNSFTQIVSVFTGNVLDISYSFDYDVLEGYVQGLAKEETVVPIDAKVYLDEINSRFEVEPASVGYLPDTSTVADQVRYAVENLDSVVISLELLTQQPTYTTSAGQALADQINALLTSTVTLNARQDLGLDEVEVEASLTKKASWISLTESSRGYAYDYAVDYALVTAWVEEVAQQTNVATVNEVQKVTSTGEYYSTVTAGQDGYVASNVSTIAGGLYSSFSAGADYVGTFTYEVEEATVTTQVMAEGAENLSYAALEGEKWIDVNLSQQTVTVYEGSTIVYGPVSVVSGAKGTETVTGTFEVYLKYRTQTMRGYNLDGSEYETEDVPWVTYFYKGYGFHGAPWRSTFGWAGYYSGGGSHGCLNMPVAAAKFIYEWSEIGTVVRSHY